MDDRKVLPTDGNLTPLYGYDIDQDIAFVGAMVWDTDSLSWVKMGQPVINTDSLTVSGSMTVSNFPETQTIDGEVSVSNFPETQKVTLDGESVEVTGTFYPETQEVSGSVVVSGGVAIENESIPVTGAFFQETQPVSLASAPLPSGAATSEKQDDIVEGITNKDLFEAIRNLLRAIVYPPWIDRSANAIRNQVQSGTVTTVTTLTNQTNIGSYTWNTKIQTDSVGIWASSVRRTIS